MRKLIEAVEQLAQRLEDGLAVNAAQPQMLESTLANSQANPQASPQTAQHSHQGQDGDTDQHQRNMALLATALQQALEPLTVRLDEKLQVDKATEQSGKLIASSLHRLNEIMDEFE